METTTQTASQPGHDLNIAPYPVPRHSPLYALRQALETNDAETAWGHTVRAMEQTAEEFFVLAFSTDSDRVKLTALKTYERLVREMARHFEWLAKRDQRDTDRAAKDLKAVTSGNFASGAVKTIAGAETADSGVSLPTPPAPRPERGRGEFVPPSFRDGPRAVSGEQGGMRPGGEVQLTRQQRRQREREQVKAARRAEKQAQRTEDKRAA